MKTKLTAIRICISCCLLFSNTGFGQGRVVINEFMSWSGCTTTSEFIELLNFGPGPMNIGCYIVTNGTYSVTIPPNTIIQPGKYFVLSGQDILAQGCANTDSAIHISLNWTTCNCTNTAVPTTGDGFLKDGGSANEKIILLDPALNVVDAVSRNQPVTASANISTPTLSGGCTSKTFDLDNMSVNYETIGISTGIDNSFARKVDGDCGWVKTTAISAGAPNKTGSSSSTAYSFNTVSASNCQSTTGTISIQVSGSNVASLFPMNYTLAYDADSNNTFNQADTYSYGVDSTPTSIDINNLAYGRYRITVATSSSCDLKNFDFFIFNCYGVVLPVKLLYFKWNGTQNGQQTFSFKINDWENLKEAVLEQNGDAFFEAAKTIAGPFNGNEVSITAPPSSSVRYRLRLKDRSDRIIYSDVIEVTGASAASRFWPNPVKDKLFIEVNALQTLTAKYFIYTAAGARIKEGAVHVKKGRQVIPLTTDGMKGGMYYLTMENEVLSKPVRFLFIKSN
jgi:hypothetical protein